jgi:hypothetical protein
MTILGSFIWPPALLDEAPPLDLFAARSEAGPPPPPPPYRKGRKEGRKVVKQGRKEGR